MDNVNEATESAIKLKLVKDQNSQDTLNEEDYFRSSQSLENDPECQIKLKTQKVPFQSKNQFSKSDFEIIGLLGKGSYARVVKARLIKNDCIYAIKIIDKIFIENVLKCPTII